MAERRNTGGSGQSRRIKLRNIKQAKAQIQNIGIGVIFLACFSILIARVFLASDCQRRISVARGA